MDSPFVILGRWDGVGNLVLPGLGTDGLRDNAENRRIANPLWTPSGGADVRRWHQDSQGVTPVIALWSNVYPTEVLLPDGTIVRGGDGDIVLLDNRVVRHRVPLDYQLAVEEGRALPRQLVRWFGYTTPSFKEIKGWKDTLARRAT